MNHVSTLRHLLSCFVVTSNFPQLRSLISRTFLFRKLRAERLLKNFVIETLTKKKSDKLFTYLIFCLLFTDDGAGGDVDPNNITDLLNEPGALTKTKITKKL